MTSDHNVRFNTLLQSLCVLALLLLMPATLLAEQETDEKAIRVRDPAKELSVSFEAAKATYRTGEPIRFKVRGNQKFYLYLFSVNRRDNSSIMLLPNNKQKDNLYEANQTFTVPTTVEFYADTAGTEEVVMVASLKPLNFDTSRYQKSGDFLSGDAQTVDDQVKALRIRTREETGKEPVVKQLELVITGKSSRGMDVPRSESGGTSGAGNNKAVVFLSADQSSYALGDDVRVVFGANQPGWVHVYAIEPRGQRELLKSQEVSGEKIYQLTARAAQPTGDHTLVAVYSPTEQPQQKVLELLNQDTSPKGLRLVEEEGPVAVYRFQIRD